MIFLILVKVDYFDNIFLSAVTFSMIFTILVFFLAAESSRCIALGLVGIDVWSHWSQIFFLAILFLFFEEISITSFSFANSLNFETFLTLTLQF